MKYILPIFIIVLFFSACKNTTEEKNTEVVENTEIEAVAPPITYPEGIQKLFQAHGGINKWNGMENLCFEMDGKNGTETHSVSLKDRRTKIETKNWTIGYDGSQVWLLENEKGSYEGNARFYHNLMFYFYAMPFVLGDDGINYTQLESAELDGKTYNAVKISYDNGVGDSPEDEYIVYLDPETSQMEWLGYTVTYTEKEKSNDWHFIKYSDWQEVNGLLLPKKLTWYTVENNLPAKKRNDVKFEKIIATETVLEPSVFAKPEAAIVVER
ncbi:hypothetical protein ATE92_1948 [Ulvibacter sp. MAR_2010_11]|uniref:DUF6503 family protein n=1 Tax=Ulvibacter sp. MAR_2010_11 TaxID=1250229 RepID=UPI000C2BC658|nr:DUF6503 family protein [Ulvibacter sp. MAR_2010_11]PKA83782.1 hypothetical protein ATE92_1948 [Ulvibacter sp. MAR_2010_11]